MKFSKNIIWYIIGVAAVVGGGFAVYWFFIRKSNTNNVPIVGGGGGGASDASSLPLQEFTISDRYYLNGTPTVYASIADAFDKTLEDSGFGNRLGLLYADSITNGFIAYSSNSRTTKYPTGIYYFPSQNTVLQINNDGVITVHFDEEKPTNLTSNTVTIGTT